jgi:hypothetical protein
MIVAPELLDEVVEEVKAEQPVLSFTPIPEPVQILPFDDGEEKKTSKRKKKNDE